MSAARVTHVRLWQAMTSSQLAEDRDRDDLTENGCEESEEFPSKNTTHELISSLGGEKGTCNLPTFADDAL